MQKRLYISDWHYGHANAIEFDQRPFRSVEEMNAALVTRWNDVVSPEDLVYVLGDFFWCKSSDAVPVLKSLHGTKFLIRGNHDRSNDGAFIKQFAKVTDYMEVDDDGRKVVLCHYPIPCYKNHYHGWIHLYGHVHTSFEWEMMKDVQYKMEHLHGVPCRMYNVGAMLPYMDYTPRTLTEILDSAESCDILEENTQEGVVPL